MRYGFILPGGMATEQLEQAIIAVLGRLAHEQVRRGGLDPPVASRRAAR